LGSSFVSFDSASCRRVALTAALALHVGAAIGVLALRPMPHATGEAQPILVQWIAPEQIEPPKPLPPAPPKVVPKKPAPKPAPRIVQPEPPPLIAADAAPLTPQAPTVQPPPPAEPAPVPVPAAPAVSAAPAKVAEPAPLPISPPSFDAAYLRNPAPAYPAQSRRMGETGRVILRVLVTVSGMPERVELRTSSGSTRLDGAALEAVQRWKFVPARQGETPVSAWVLVPILFTLEG
jgi:periplasmic protein TonB